MGPVEKVVLFGHPIVSIAPTTFGLPEVSSNYKATIHFISYFYSFDVGFVRNQIRSH
jgi:hypothetical protein